MAYFNQSQQSLHSPNYIFHDAYQLSTTGKTCNTVLSKGLLWKQGQPVAGVVRARAVHTDNDEHVLEVRANILRSERKCSRLLEYNRDYIISYVPLPQEL